VLAIRLLLRFAFVLLLLTGVALFLSDLQEDAPPSVAAAERSQ
jgi:hypothetical protein